MKNKITISIVLILLISVIPISREALSSNDPCFFATSVIEYTGSGNTDLILGGPRGEGDDQGSLHVLSLENNGSVTLGFDVTITNGQGPDFIVFENPFYIQGSGGAVFAELAYVKVSTDGTNFARFPSISLTQQGQMMFPENIENLAGVYPVYANVDENTIDPCDPSVAGGDAFDLDDLTTDPLVQSGLVDLANINFVRLIDIYGDGSCLDSLGNPIYDPTGYGNTGSDFDAISVVNYLVNTDEWAGQIRIEGSSDTIWKGEVTFGSSSIIAENADTGLNETHYIPFPSVLGALDETSKTAGFSYHVYYYPMWDAFYVDTIDGDLDYWHYWVDYTLSMLGAGAYELTNENEVLWGYVEDWYPDVLRITLDKNKVNTSEQFTITIYNLTMAPVEGATVYVGSESYTTDAEGKVITEINTSGTFTIYAEKNVFVRSEKKLIQVMDEIKIQIVKPKDNAIYLRNRELKIKLRNTIIIGSIDVEVEVTNDIIKVEYYINDELKHTDSEPPFEWKWNERSLFRKTLKVKAYDGNNWSDDEINVFVFML